MEQFNGIGMEIIHQLKRIADVLESTKSGSFTTPALSPESSGNIQPKKKDVKTLSNLSSGTPKQEGNTQDDTRLQTGRSASSPVDNHSADFIPTEEQLIAWSNQDVTIKQRELLLKLGLPKEEIDNSSKLEAYQLIQNLKKENI